MLRVREQTPPRLGGYGGAVWVRDAYLLGGRLRFVRPGQVGPQVTLGPSGQRDQGGAVARVRYASGQPPVDGLWVDDRSFLSLKVTQRA